MTNIFLVLIFLTLLLILNKQNKMATKLEELEQLAIDLQASVDAKQAQLATAIAAFEQTIADLTAQIGNGGANDAALQSIIDKVTAAKSDLEATPLS